MFIRRVVSVIALAATGVATSGCALLLTGYIVGDAIQKSKAVDTCRANLQTTNHARIVKGQEPFPDQCGQ